MYKIITQVIATGLIGLAGATDGYTESLKRKKMNHIEVAIPSVIEDVDPMKMWNYYHFMLAQSMYSTLVRINDQGLLVAHLAESWKKSTDSKTYTLKLNNKAKFSDGEAVTASDVAHSFARHLWPKAPSVINGYLLDTIKGSKGLKNGNIPAGIKVIDNHTIQFTLNEPYAPFMYMLAMPGFSILSAKNITKSTCGPMTGKYNSKAKKWELKHNKNYFVDKVKNRSMNIRGLRGTEAIEKAFKNKEIDIILGIPIGEAKEMKLPKDVVLKPTDTLSFNHLFFNTNKKEFQNIETRKIIGRFIQEIAWQSKYLNKFQEKLTTYLPSGVMPQSYYQRKLENLKKDTVLATLKKIKSTVKIVVIEHHFNQKFLDELETKLKALGLKITLSRISGGDYVKALKSKDYDIISGPYIGNFPDPDGFLEPLKPHSPMRIGNFKVQPLLDKLSEARHLADSKQRLEQYGKILNNFEDEWSFIPLYRINFPIVYHTALKVPDSSYRYEAELWNIFWN